MAKRVENIQINDVLAPPPYINKTTNTWWLYDFDSGEYVDTSIRAEGKDGADGRSPYIENGTWWEWNAETGRYEDTGVQADIEVGGVNLIQNGNFFNGLSNWNINSPTEKLPEISIIQTGTDLPDGVLSCLKVTATSNGQGVWQNLMNKLELNRTYTLSFLLKKSGAEKFELYFGHEENIQTREITKTDTWERHIYRFIPTTRRNIVFYANNAGTFYITNIQLEKGNIATDYAPSPQDVKENFAKITADTNRSKAVTDQFSTNEGGLWSSVILELHEPEADETAPMPPTTAGISGMQGNENKLPAFWTGGTYADAIDNLAKIIMRHDGSGHLAGGNLWWDLLGNLFLGKEFDSKSILITPSGSIPSYSEITNKEKYKLPVINETINKDFNNPAHVETASDLFVDYTQEFDLKNDAILNINAEMDYTWGADLREFGTDGRIALQKYDSNRWVDVKYVSYEMGVGFNYYNFDVYNLHVSRGKYRLIANTICGGETPFGPDATVTLNKHFSIEYQLKVKKLVIASDGIAFYDSLNDNYFRLSLVDENVIDLQGNAKLKSPNGQHQLQITDTGIRKSNNSGASWVNL